MALYPLVINIKALVVDLGLLKKGLEGIMDSEKNELSGLYQERTAEGKVAGLGIKLRS